MLHCFEVLTTSGVVLWSKHYAPVGVSVVNSFVRDVFIEDRSSSATGSESASRNPAYKKEKYTLKWTTAKDFGLIFVAVYQSLISLSWVEQLLDNVKTLFTALYGHQFQKPYTSMIECPLDDYFNRQIAELERQIDAAKKEARTHTPPEVNDSPPLPQQRNFSSEHLAPPVPTLRKTTVQKKGLAVDTEQEISGNSSDGSAISTPTSSRPGTPNAGVITGKTGPMGRVSRRARKAAYAAGGAPTSAPVKKVRGAEKGGKKMRRWDADGAAAEGEDTSELDYSVTSPVSDSGISNGSAITPGTEPVDQFSWGKKDASGAFVLKDLDDEMSSILASAKASSTSESAANGSSAPSDSLLNRATATLTSTFANLMGGKTLSHADLQKPLQTIRNHLIQRNVARDAAEQLCNSVERDLVGTKTASFTSFDSTVRASMDKALGKILTPASGSSLDLLRAVQSVRGKRPYILSLVGVNGVGKSTTLAKLAFLLLHNNLRVLVAAADTFRSGAVEQLRVHVSRLQQLTSQQDDVGHIDLFEKGYGKDAAAIAKEAIKSATDGGYDVVLVDTAGRRHNDQRLMSSLGTFAKQAQPDKVLLVCEALVGTDSVAQARHFNESFGAEKGGRGIDGFIVSKCDTVGGMVGTLVSLVWSTGVPVVAVGVGQHYGDLRGFKVQWARELLLGP
ncbi:MAG: hypothetical protein Q9159_002404 [Coniocarpon cinnabarinum]